MKQLHVKGGTIRYGISGCGCCSPGEPRKGMCVNSAPMWYQLVSDINGAYPWKHLDRLPCGKTPLQLLQEGVPFEEVLNQSEAHAIRLSNQT